MQLFWYIISHCREKGKPRALFSPRPAVDHQHAAKRPGKRRVPEKRLFLLALLGGGLGATAGMFVFHHKTRHWTFRLGFPAILLAQLALVLFLWLRWG